MADSKVVKRTIVDVLHGQRFVPSLNGLRFICMKHAAERTSAHRYGQRQETRLMKPQQMRVSVGDDDVSISRLLYLVAVITAIAFFLFCGIFVWSAFSFF